VHKFCTTLMEKTVGEIGILNSDLFSDQFFLQCNSSFLPFPLPFLLLSPPSFLFIPPLRLSLSILSVIPPPSYLSSPPSPTCHSPSLLPVIPPPSYLSFPLSPTGHSPLSYLSFPLPPICHPPTLLFSFSIVTDIPPPCHSPSPSPISPSDPFSPLQFSRPLSYLSFSCHVYVIFPAFTYFFGCIFLKHAVMQPRHLCAYSVRWMKRIHCIFVHIFLDFGELQTDEKNR
jgi:hypothetical protein